MACVALRDHAVALFADDYAKNEGLELTPETRATLLDGWAFELEKRGSLQRFAASCAATLTRTKYTCGMASSTPDGLAACMRLSRAEEPSGPSDPRRGHGRAA